LNYLPDATGDAVKVYLYGLLACADGEENTIDRFSSDIKLDRATVEDCFIYWEEFGLVDIISKEPFSVRYLPEKSAVLRRYSPEKYSEFSKSLQVMFPQKMISTAEFSAYYEVMEEFSVKPEAMLMIVKYCADLKGDNISFRYIVKVARDFASRGLTTCQKIENEISVYNVHTASINQIFSVLSPKKKPDVEDLDRYEKWTKDLGFSLEAILVAAKRSKSKNTLKLDRELIALYGAKKFSIGEIEKYYDDKNERIELAYEISRQLSVYTEVIDPVIENYLSPWQSMGYTGETLLFIANLCFKNGRRSFEKMDDTVRKFYSSGLVSLSSVAEYLKRITVDDEFIKKILSLIGVDRRPTDWDRQNLKTWRGWNFSDEMIEEAAKLSYGKSPAYVNSILSNWKSQNIFSVDKISASPSSGRKTNFDNFEKYKRNYTKEELDSLIDDIDDIEF
ncbi:MAG: DnaD domain protein, partial [Clostridia bacterium]|nr:DnaD domain protein [Clostridia bacterium]